MQKGFIRFLNDIRASHYDLDFTSFHSSNLIAQEGIINYDVDLDDSLVVLILGFFIKLDVEPVNKKGLMNHQ